VQLPSEGTRNVNLGAAVHPAFRDCHERAVREPHGKRAITEISTRPPNDLSLSCGEALSSTCDAARRLPQLTNSRRAASASAVTPPLLEDSLAGSAGGPHGGPPSAAVRELGAASMFNLPSSSRALTKHSPEAVASTLTMARLVALSTHVHEFFN